jgi:hypothetical protein
LLLPEANLPNRRPGGGRVVRSHAQAGGSGPVSLRDADRFPRGKRSHPGMPLEPTPGEFSLPLGFKDHAFNAPNATTSGPASRPCFRAHSSPHFASRNPCDRRADKPSSAAQAGRRSGQFRSPCGSDRRDPNSLAPNRLEARTTRYARQGLVRVPESNTKYGGGQGKTGVVAAPVIEASIGESWEIPKRKN